MPVLPSRRKAFRTESGGVAGDPYFANVVLLMHCNGTNGSTIFTDSSPASRIVTATGNAQISTAQSKFNGSSGLFDGASDFLDLADSVDWHFGSGDFTIELWLRPSSLTGSMGILAQRTGSAFCPFVIYTNGTSLNVLISFNNSSWAAVPTISGGALSVNTWNYIAFKRAGSSFSLWLNGAQVGTYTSSSSFTDLAQILRFGGLASAWLNGYAAEIRITKGVARDVSVVPTAAFPDSTPSGNDPFGTSVALLLHFDGTDGSTSFIDSSSSAHTVTAYGNAQLDTADKKFGSAAGLFDGTGDYLEVGPSSKFALGTNNFTLEFWINLNSKNSNTTAIRTASSNGFDGILALHAATLGLYITSTGTSWNILSSASAFNGLTTGTWNHIAITRSGSSFMAFLNGILVATATSSAAIYQSTNLLRLAAANSLGGFAMNGWLDEFRLTVGVARYTANFMPPTAAFPDPGTIFTSYLNPGGSGDRTATIPVTASAGLTVGVLTRFVGIGASGTYFANAQTSGWLKFDFGTAKIINELKYYQSNAVSQGTWQFEGSNDDSTWTAVGSPFEITGTAFVSGSAFISNTNSYRYYRINKTGAGATSSGAWAYQFEFKISS
jgi:hypothetical protein